MRPARALRILAAAIAISGCGSLSGAPVATDASAGGDLSDMALAAPPARLPANDFGQLPSGGDAHLAFGLVSGRIYEDLDAHAADRMRDFAALGVRILRVEIERATPWDRYRRIIAAAHDNGIEILAVLTGATLPDGSPAPAAGTLADFDQRFVPAFVAALDDVTLQLPTLRYVEIWNEPDVYSFGPLYRYPPCQPTEAAVRYALLVTRIFERSILQRESGANPPRVVGFDTSNVDDRCLAQALFDSTPVSSHRRAFRPQHGLPDGPPVDIVSNHGYGTPGFAPFETGYTYAGGTFADGVDDYLALTFSDGAPIFANTFLWYTEIGYGLDSFAARADPESTQRDSLAFVFDVLRRRSAKVKALFWYDYRDDEPSGNERFGLRANSTATYRAHSSYFAYQAGTVAAFDDVAPAGALESPAAMKAFARATRVDVAGWTIDANGAPAVVDIALDGLVVATIASGQRASPTGCTIASSASCPMVGFSSQITLPDSVGLHEIAARAVDSAGNARVIDRRDVIVTN